MIAGGNWWRANEIVIRHLSPHTKLRYLGVTKPAEDIVLRFDPSAAPDARTYLFHPTHTMIDEADGSLTVRFRAAGLLQIAHHLMTWGSTVAILAPDRLKALMWEEVDALHHHYRKMRRRSRTAKAAAE
jgi:predicted DNA-binding transcriptional regulator YafY